MSFFDAISHSFSTVSIGGFSTHDLSIGYFNSKTIDAIAVFFMFSAGINFALHFVAWRTINLKTYFQDTEFKTYIRVIFVLCVITCSYLIYENVYPEYA